MTTVDKESHVYCKPCNSKLTSRKSALKDHMQTLKHKRLAAPFTFKPLALVKENIEVQKNEARLALFIAKHTSISSVDHLVKVNNSYSVNNNPKG